LNITDKTLFPCIQVAPAELEAVLLSNPEVSDVGVAGIPDLSSGELPVAWVVKRSMSTITKEDLLRYVEST
jgi:4-coumarate--CoA ligase